MAGVEPLNPARHHETQPNIISYEKNKDVTPKYLYGIDQCEYENEMGLFELDYDEFVEGLFNVALDKGLLIPAQDDIKVVEGPFDDAKIGSIVGCQSIKKVTCTVGELADKFELYMDNEGALNLQNVNGVATRMFRDQLSGGKLYGDILVLRSGVVE